MLKQRCKNPTESSFQHSCEASYNALNLRSERKQKHNLDVSTMNTNPPESRLFWDLDVHTRRVIPSNCWLFFVSGSFDFFSRITVHQQPPFIASDYVNNKPKAIQIYDNSYRLT